MTTVRFNVRPGVTTITGEPSRRRVTPAGIDLPAPRVVAELVNGEGLGELDPTCDSWGRESWYWKLREVSSVGIVRFVAVPDSVDVVDYTDLLDVDPAAYESSEWPVKVV